MNTEKYLSLLKRNLIDSMTKGDCDAFQQDNAPCHISNKAKKLFSEQHIPLIAWPGNSSDINPIENLRRLVKGKLVGFSFGNLTELLEEIRRIWSNDINVKLCQRLVDSLPQRIASIVKDNGYPCKY